MTNSDILDATDRIRSYAIGGTGIAIGGLSWSGIVALAGDLTTIIGFFTAIIGFCVVLMRLIRDMKRV